MGRRSRADRSPRPVLQRFGRGTHMKHVAAHLRSADDAAFKQFEQLCLSIGTPVIAPLAEALSAEQDARSRRRLRDVLVGFGAQGRDVVQQLMNAPNWEVQAHRGVPAARVRWVRRACKELIPLLTDSEPLVQREAVQGLVLNGSTEAAAILVSAFGTVSGRARETLVAELTSIRDRRASPFFCLPGPAPGSRQACRRLPGVDRGTRHIWRPVVGRGARPRPRCRGLVGAAPHPARTHGRGRGTTEDRLPRSRRGSSPRRRQGKARHPHRGSRRTGTPGMTEPRIESHVAIRPV